MTLKAALAQLEALRTANPGEVSLDAQNSDASALVRMIRQKLLDHREMARG